MHWTEGGLDQLQWAGTTLHRGEKEDVTHRVAAMAQVGDVIGVGSGSTTFLALQYIGPRFNVEGLHCSDHGGFR